MKNSHIYKKRKKKKRKFKIIISLSLFGKKKKNSRPSDDKPPADRRRDKRTAPDGDAKRGPPRRQVELDPDPVDERVGQRGPERGDADPRGLCDLGPSPRQGKHFRRCLGRRREALPSGHAGDVEPRRRERERVPDGVEDAVGEDAGEAVPPEAVEGRGAAEPEIVFFCGFDDYDSMI